METKIPCLNHGFVELQDVMGDDKAIVDAARTSISGKGVKATSQDRGLIRYLLRKGHTTPFEMVEFKFRAKMPIFVARQWIRHRTASVNEMSARYSELPEEFYVPVTGRIREQAWKNKQGTGEKELSNAVALRDAFANEATFAFDRYKDRLDFGMARELARVNLPLSTYTEWIWKQDLHNLFHLLRLRIDEHAQFEIRVYAQAMARLIQPHVPIAWEAFEDFRLKAVTLTAQDVEALRLIRAKAETLDDEVRGVFKTKREADEFEAKWERIFKA